MITGQQSPSDQLPFCSSELPWGERECKPTMLSSLINYITRMNLQTFPRVAVWAPNDSSGLAEFCSLWHLQLVIRSHKSGGGGSSCKGNNTLLGSRDPPGVVILLQEMLMRVWGWEAKWAGLGVKPHRQTQGQAVLCTFFVHSFQIHLTGWIRSGIVLDPEFQS